jgi:hypothetical protein
MQITIVVRSCVHTVPIDFLDTVFRLGEFPLEFVALVRFETEVVSTIVDIVQELRC